MARAVLRRFQDRHTRAEVMSDDVWCAKPTPTNNTSEIRYESNDENEQVSVLRVRISTVLSGVANFLLD
jgi:hypothetical protein